MKMIKAVLLMCLIGVLVVSVQSAGPCPSGWTFLATGCYKIVTTSFALSYQGAMTKCKQEKGYLVEMDNQGEQDAIIQFLEENKINEHVWLGGTDADETGKWIGGYTGKEIMKFDGWDSESPSHVGTQHCILTDPSRKFKWNDYWCNSDSQGYRPKAALCEYSPCPSGWTSLATGCYKIVTTSFALSYQRAMTKCKQEKGYLVEMDNQGEQDAIIQFLEKNRINEHVWLGGTDAEETGKWIGGYTGKEIMKFNGWDSESPSHVGTQHCILTDPSRKFKWNDYWCNSDSQGYRPKAALCEYMTTQCGIENPGREISGGSVTGPNQYPWMVRLPMGCGGSLITDIHILTARHCLVGSNWRGKKVKVGVHNQDDPNDYQEVSIKDYVWPNKNNHDIAIIILDTPVNLNDKKIGTVCLPSSAIEDYRGHQGTAMGWGMTHQGSPQSPLLQHVELTVSQKEQTNYFYTEVPVVNGVPQDPCAGDSGGPLVHRDVVSGRWTIIGTVYGAGYDCRTGNTRGKGKWNKVTDHLVWIHSVIGN